MHIYIYITIIITINDIGGAPSPAAAGSRPTAGLRRVSMSCMYACIYIYNAYSWLILCLSIYIYIYRERYIHTYVYIYIYERLP